MEKSSNNLKVAIIGPYPPPYGGISTYVQRMHYCLRKRNIEHIIYTNIDDVKANLVNIVKTKKWFLKYLCTAKEDVLHFHNIDWRERVLMSLMRFRGKKVILTIHGKSLEDQIRQNGWLKRRILIYSLKNISNIVVVNPKIKSLLISHGIKPDNVECITPFVPPTIINEDIAQIPQKIWGFIDTHKPIVSANASKIVFYDNYDLYGIDMCIDLCGYLKKDYPQIGFIFFLPDIGDYEYFNKMKEKINEKRLDDNFLFQTKPCQMYPVIMKSDIFVRPTNTDGYGISVAEAIYFKVPSVASNVCQRPEGTILFKNRDISDFTAKVNDVLSNYEFHKNRIEDIELGNYVEELLEMYNKLAEKK